jgi:uncharacterized damage-inducible protein DinB
MTVQDLTTLFDYGYWANKKLFEVVAKLTPEQFEQFFSDNHGSIRNTMVHMLSAEWGWLERSGGPARGAPLKPEDYPTPESLIAGWNKVEMLMREFLSKLRDEDLAKVLEFTLGTEKRSMPVAEMLQQAANHGVHHRGQISLLLRLRGYNPDNFDIVLYHLQKHRS